MEKFKGTQGEWKRNGRIIFIGGSQTQSNFDQVILKAYTSKFYERAQEEAEANAKLIAAAPELLKALQETDKDLCVLWGQMLDLEKTNPIAEGLSNLIQNWRDRNKQAINKALK